MTVQGRMRGAFGGAAAVLVATAISGAAGYVVTALVGVSRDAADYAVFAVFWAALYLVVGALSGVQQEVTRATTPVGATGRGGAPAGAGARASRFAAVASALVLVAIAGTGPLWAPAVLGGDEGARLALPLAVGAAGYLVVAVVCGTMYGVEAWSLIALMIGIDGVLRLALVAVVLATTEGIVALSWAVVAPYPLVPLLLFVVIRRRLRGASVLDVGYRRLLRNLVGTLIGAIASAVLVSAFPLLLRASSPGVPDGELGAFVFANTLARAPLVVVFLSLQSYFVVFFKARPALGRPILALVALVLGGTAVLAAVAALVGPWLLVTVFGESYAVDAPVLAGIVGAAGVMAVLCVTGPAVLAGGAHSAFALGWTLAAAVTIAALFLPGELAPRALLALTLGPLVGALAHLVALRRTSDRRGNQE